MAVAEDDLTVAETLDEQDRCVVWLNGEVDAHNSATITRAVTAGEHGRRTVVIDLTDVSFLDSSGLHALLDCREQLHARGQRLVVRNATQQVRRIFEITGLTNLFDC